MNYGNWNWNVKFARWKNNGVYCIREMSRILRIVNQCRYSAARNLQLVLGMMQTFVVGINVPVRDNPCFRTDQAFISFKYSPLYTRMACIVTMFMSEVEGEWYFWWKERCIHKWLRISPKRCRWTKITEQEKDQKNSVRSSLHIQTTNAKWQCVFTTKS